MEAECDEAELADSWALHETTAWPAVDFIVDTELEDSFLTDDLLELCILAKLVAEARLIPGFILWTRLGLVRDPFCPPSWSSGMVTSAVPLSLPPPKVIKSYE